MQSYFRAGNTSAVLPGLSQLNDMDSEIEYITLDETGVDAPNHTGMSLNDSSKRKADESDSDIIVESSNPRKRLCQKSPEPCTQKGDLPCISVCFASQSISSQYGTEISNFISGLIKADITTSLEKDGMSHLEFYRNYEENPGKEDDVQILEHECATTLDDPPTYDQTFDGVVGVVLEDQKDVSESKPKNVCFNCNGDHMIAVCPEPRDSAKIAKNRREHHNKNPTYSRYHEEADQRFGHLKPGEISAGLREALGLHPQDLPMHMYRMRVLGYPPGWLRAARLQRSHLVVLHTPKPDGQEKECKREENLYDHSKLIAFHGFNHRVLSDVRDMHHRLGFPPMQSHQSLSSMKHSLPTRHHHVTEPAAVRADTTDVHAQDMEVVGEDDTTEAQNEPATEANGVSDSPRSGSQSPSLEVLEEQRRLLQSKLEAGGDDSLDEPPLVRAPRPAAHSTPLTLTPGTSRRRELGTPVGAAAVSRLLPDAGKWADGITEHIPHENLPGATGAWDRMSDLIKRVRSHVTGKR